MIPKFRAWDKETKQFVEIDVIYFSMESLWIKIVISSSLNHVVNRKFDEIELMQSTGLKDKNGVEVFEGDIVKHSADIKDISIVKFGEFGVPNIEEQQYQDAAIGFYFENASDLKDVAPFNMTIPLNNVYVKDIEVIGNVHENKELLEVSE